MCKRIHLSKYCLGHGPTGEWEMVSEHKCNCGLTPEDIYRQPHPYFNFRCDDCIANDRWYENSPAGIKWAKDYAAEQAKKKEQEEAKAKTTRKNRGSGSR
ncbi:hypothetical protein F4778DRAFT_775431 [Xylariomycetidae sp. FL2044]|nr:hypothetical protein F4778DRAFT_775431 [Xylariomycetidae sp. FL2044]